MDTLQYARIARFSQRKHLLEVFGREGDARAKSPPSLTVTHVALPTAPAAATAGKPVGLYHHVSKLGREVRVVAGINLSIDDNARAGAEIADVEKHKIRVAMLLLFRS